MKFNMQSLVSYNISILLSSIACLRYTTEAHVCLLKKRWEPVTASHRWSLPLNERCRCLWVVAPKIKSPSQSCPLGREYVKDPSELWFTDDEESLTTRSNWKPHLLDKLLERAEYCSEYPKWKKLGFSASSQDCTKILKHRGDRRDDIQQMQVIKRSLTA